MEEKEANVKYPFLNIPFYIWLVNLILTVVLAGLGSHLSLILLFLLLITTSAWLLVSIFKLFKQKIDLAKTEEEVKKNKKTRLWISIGSLVAAFSLWLWLFSIVTLSNPLQESGELLNFYSNEEDLEKINGYWYNDSDYYAIVASTKKIFIFHIGNKTYTMENFYTFQNGISYNTSLSTITIDNIRMKSDDQFSADIVTDYNFSDNEPYSIKYVFNRISEEEFTKAAEEFDKEAGLTSKENNDTSESNSSVLPTTYSSGTYKVGTDIPAGEYLLTTTGKNGYVAVNADSSGEFSSLLSNDNFQTRDYVIVNDSEYLQLGSGVIATPMDQATPATSATLTNGTFKVGFDLSAGEYQVTGGGYWARLYSPNDVMGDIIANDNFEGSTYVTVKDGEYLQLSNGATITK